MNPVDPIILTAYVLCIAYFLYLIVDAFNDEFTIHLDADFLRQQLENQNLEGLIDISFKFDSRYEFDKLKQLAISIKNQAAYEPVDDKPHGISLYVDWDYCAFTDLDGRSRRVTRLMPGTTVDLFQNQVFSTITPNSTLKETITAEDLLQRKGERKADKLDSTSPANLEIEVTKPLIDLSKPGIKAPAKAKERYARFMQRYTDLTFFLELAFRIVGPHGTASGDRVYILCKFVMHKLPWTAGLPWNPKS
ncbi:hypothetical protein H6F86_29600 [Phormidium sp. FACHB-592]|uniref:Uncharacterized protein n=1 Tax=Stenomitos frigidus AS-A4 TaxID=2933935 RepID=A0ABV0KFY7_9CYAN|nr:hypothetical protein [Phormidium sp. FACHB-592]MBD2077970.1 hypothetical protein [Phormidium sp. FACHB-592]